MYPKWRYISRHGRAAVFTGPIRGEHLDGHGRELALPNQPDIPVRVNPYFKKNRTFKMRPLRRLVPA